MFNGTLGLIRQLCEQIDATAPVFRARCGVSLEIPADTKARLLPGFGLFDWKARLLKIDFWIGVIDEFALAAAFQTHSPGTTLLYNRFFWPLAQVADDAFFAQRLARDTSVAPVQDKPMVSMLFVFCRNHLI